MAVNLPEKMSNQSLHILHLSDIHFKKDKYKYDRTKIVDELFKGIERHIRYSKIKTDLVFVTGDIAWAGGEDEYTEPLNFLAKLIELINNPELRLYVVPGNHDIIRDIAKDDTLRYENKTRWNRLLEREFTNKSSKIKERLTNYFIFLDELNGVITNTIPYQSSDFCYTDTFDHNGCTVIILGLNSAWACEDDNDDGEIALGEVQVSNACKSIPSDPRILTLPLALMHHPFSSYHTEDRVSYDKLRNNCQLVFRGHCHKGVTTTTGIDGVQIHELSTSATYLETEEEEIGFQFVIADPTNGLCYVWPYLWNGSYFYLPNERSMKINENGFIDFRFRESERADAEKIIEVIDSSVEEKIQPLRTTHSELYKNIDEARDSIKKDCKDTQTISIFANKGLAFFGIPESIVSIAEYAEYEKLKKIRIILLGTDSRWINEGLVEQRPYEDVDTFIKELKACHTIVESNMNKFPPCFVTAKSGVRYHTGEPYVRMIMTDQVVYVSSYNIPPEIKVRDCPVYKFYNIPGSLYGALKRYFDDIWHNNSLPGLWQKRTICLEESAGGIVLADKDNEYYFILLKREDGYWILPKGHKMKTDRDIRQTAIREVSEETGIEKQDLEIIRKLDQYAYDETMEGEKSHKVVHLFLMRYKGEKLPNLHPDPSHAGAAWFKMTDELPSMLYSNQRNILFDLGQVFKMYTEKFWAAKYQQ